MEPKGLPAVAAGPEAGTIDDLVADAANAGYRVTPRTVHDWVAKGLIDRPERRRAGRSGSLKALYSGEQRLLFLHLLSARSEQLTVHDLAGVVIGVWHSLDDCVPTRQALRALRTWVGDSRSSKSEARRLARMHTKPFTEDPRLGTAHDRRELLRVVSDVFYTGRIDVDLLKEKARPIFEPREKYISIVHSRDETVVPDVETLVALLETITRAGQSVSDGTVTEACLDQARILLRYGAESVGMADLLTVLGLFALHPETLDPSLSSLDEPPCEVHTISVF
ncbi:hypothetical protein KGQ20_19160 [Catenulispora sp. NF23]|uniref:hypothetical protein n=1 Tax=Catenulispora pinistramenti TaxID=2705254 RepID=UPI001BACB255|nr:hypothetical protein [Catenulispora pinistramenti]MBS2534893.1 hypothetical protein [Catenulispora pinistramenti]